MNAIELHDIHRTFRTTTGTIRRHRADVVALDGTGAQKAITIMMLTRLLGGIEGRAIGEAIVGSLPR